METDEESSPGAGATPADLPLINCQRWLSSVTVHAAAHHPLRLLLLLLRLLLPLLLH